MKQLFIALFVAIGLNAFAQQSSTYFDKNLPQRVTINPAFQPSRNVYVGLPVVSNVNVNLSSSENFLSLIPLEDTDNKTFLNYKTQIDNLDNDELSINVESEITELLVGVRFGENGYGQFSINELVRVDGKVDATMLHFFNRLQRAKSDFDLTMLDGLGEDINKYYTEGSYGVSAKWYRQFSLSYSHKLNEKFTIGGALKYLNLSASAQVVPLHITCQQYVDEGSEVFLFGIDMACVYTKNLIRETFEDAFHDETTLDTKLILKNRGFGIDLGATYQLISELELSFALKDIGKIKHKEETGAMGIYNGKLIKYDLAASNMDDIKSVENQNTYTHLSNEYSEWLDPQLIFGADYSVLPYLNVGLLSQTKFYDYNTQSNLTLSAQVHHRDIVNAGLSYDLQFNSKDALQFNFSVRAGAFQFFTAMNYVIFESDAIGEVDGANFISSNTLKVCAGINFAFGGNNSFNE